MVQAAALDTAGHLTADDAAALTENLRWFLGLIGDGVALTGAGYLRPALVQEVATRLELGKEWIGALNREDMTPGVADFRALVQALGLVRKLKGRLLPTKLGLQLRDDPGRLLDHVASRMPLGTDDFARQASLLVMLDLLGAPASRTATMTRCVQILVDRGWRSGPDVMTEWDVYHGIPETTAFLTRCGILEPGDRAPKWTLTSRGRAFLCAVLQGRDSIAS